MFIKRAISISLSVTLIIQSVFVQNLMAETNMIGTPSVTDDNSSITCRLKSQEDYFPVGDTTGNSIFIKREVVRECNVTKTVLGACKKWKTERHVGSVTNEAYSSFDTKDYSDSVGSFFSTMGAYDQMEHLWSGFSGYCISGTLRDFNWASDPMFWSSLAVDYAMNQPGISNKNKCLVSAAFNVIQTTVDALKKGSNSGNDCNPIDEICSDSEGDNPDNQSNANIKTMDLQVFEDLSDSMSSQGKNIYDFIEVLDDGSQTGTVTFRYKRKSEITQGTTNMSGANKAAEEMRKLQLEIGLGIAAAQMIACLNAKGFSVGGAGATKTTTKDQSKQKIQMGLNELIDIAGSALPTPYGPIAAVLAKLIVAMAMSYSKVNSCQNRNDAEQLGSRHLKTYKSLKFDLCKPMWDSCEDKFFWGKCALTGYHYCCYDQVLTKVLVEQIKAELGREWTNCTGISLRDLNYISFRQCTTTEMQDGIDGAHVYGLSISSRKNPSGSTGIHNYKGPVYDPEDAFQYKHKCMDLTEFKNFLESELGEDIDTDQFSDFWDSLTKKQPI